MKKLTFIFLTLILIFPCFLLTEGYSTYPWGIYSDEFVMPVNKENDYTKAKDAGIKWISIAALWSEIQKSKGGTNDWSELDARVDKAIASGFNIHFFVAGFPEWIAEKKGSVWKKEYPPKDDKFADWKDWCKGLANRYKDKGIKYFEIYPEGEGASGQWCGADYNKIYDKVIKIIKYANEGIKKEIPEAIIMAPGDPEPFEYKVDAGRPYSKPFIYQIENGYKSIAGLGEDVINGLSLHLYPDHLNLDSNGKQETVAPEEKNHTKLGRKNLITAIFDYYFKTTKYSDRERRIFLTEQGYSVAKDVICKENNSWVADEDTQADYIVRFHILALSTGLVDRIHYYMLRDDYPIGAPLSEDPSYTGLLKNDSTERPSYYAYKTMANTLGDKMASHLLISNNQYVVVFVDRKAKKDQNNTSRIIVAWKKTTTGSENLTISVNSTTAIQYKDRGGNVLGNLTPSGGNIVVSLTNDSPVYIFDKSMSQTYNINNQPTITSPADNTSFTHISHPITIKGTAKANTKIYLYKAGKEVTNTNSDKSGNFTFERITLTKGGNGFQVAEDNGSVSDLYNFIYIEDRFGEETTYKDEGGKITIPAYTFNKNVYPEMSKAENDPEVVNANKFDYPISKSSIVKVIIKDSQKNEIKTLNKSINIVISYQDTDNDGIVDDIGAKESDLKVIKLEDKQWKYFTTPTVNTNKNEATFSTNKLSIFALAKIDTNLSQIKAYPNPCNLNEISYITFAPIPYNTSFIKIFNIAGELVYTMTAGKGIEGNKAKWDKCTNEYGKTVSSGVYIFYLKTEDGRYQRGRFVIVK